MKEVFLIVMALSAATMGMSVGLSERHVAITTLSPTLALSACGGVCYQDGTWLCAEANIPNCNGTCTVFVEGVRYCNIDTEDDQATTSVPLVDDEGPSGGFNRGFGPQTPCAKRWDCNNSPCELVGGNYKCPAGDFVTELNLRTPSWAVSPGCPTPPGG